MQNENNEKKVFFDRIGTFLGKMTEKRAKSLRSIP